MDRLWRLTVVDYRQFSLEKEMASHSSILAWRIPWTEEPGGYSLWSRKESDTTEWLSLIDGQFYLGVEQQLSICQLKSYAAPPLQPHRTVHRLFTHRLWKPRWTETTLSFKYGGPVLWSLTAVSDHTGVDKEADSYSCYTSSPWCKSLILQLKGLLGALNNQCPELPCSSSGWESTLQLRGRGFYPWRGNQDSTCHGATKPLSPNKGSYMLQLRPNTDK